MTTERRWLKRTRSSRTVRFLLLAFVLLVVSGWSFAQGGAPDVSSDAPVEEAEVQPDEESGDEGDGGAVETLALGSFGVTGGFPAYQTVALNVGVQYRFFGAGARVGWGGSGLGAGVHLRGYPPIPVPVPTYVALGASFYDDDIAPYAALGAHIPVARDWRVDLEGGIASVQLLDRRAWAPHLQVGVSYVVVFDPADVFREGDGITRRRGGGGPACETPGPPTEAGLSGATARAVREFVRDAQATYGSVYRGLSYSYEIVRTRVDDDRAEVRIEYEGSVTEIATGERLSADGRASALFRWTGCSWALTGTRY